MAVVRRAHPREFRASSEQAGLGDVVAGNGLPNLLKDVCGRPVVERLARTELFQLMREDAQQIEIRARAHHFRGFTQKLDFARSVRDRAVFFIRGSGGEDDIRLLRGLRQEKLVSDKQLQLAATRSLAGRNE